MADFIASDYTSPLPTVAKKEGYLLKPDFKADRFKRENIEEGKRGSLMKRGSFMNLMKSLVRSEYSRRYFCLNGAKFEYYTDETQSVKKGEIDLSSCLRVEYSHIVADLSFDIIGPEQHYMIICPNRDVMLRWMLYINETLDSLSSEKTANGHSSKSSKSSKSAKGTKFSASSKYRAELDYSDALSSKFLTSGTIKSGWMKKPDFKSPNRLRSFVRSTNIGWKNKALSTEMYTNRFFELDTEACTLTYYTNESKTVKKGALPLNGIEEIEYSYLPGADQCAFDLIDSEKHYTFVAPSRKAMHAWMRVLEDLIESQYRAPTMATLEPFDDEDADAEDNEGGSVNAADDNENLADNVDNDAAEKAAGEVIEELLGQVDETEVFVDIELSDQKNSDSIEAVIAPANVEVVDNVGCACTIQ